MRTRRKALAFTLMVVAAGAAKLQLDPAPVKLSMQPERVRTCETPVATVVEWDASAIRVGSVKLEVNNLGRPPKLWVQAGRRGSAETGAWAHDGYTVTLKTPDGRVLARRTLTTEPCG
ncbi:hypothetical protein [Pseudoxanthomonas suwonensis]